MSKLRILRALVSERLAAAAEEIFVLFENTIAEYEEELCRSKEENQWKLSPRVEVVPENFQMSSIGTGPDPNLEMTEPLQMKEEPEEQSLKQEEEVLQVSVPESNAAYMKPEDSSLLQQRQTELREDISPEPLFHSQTEEHNEPASYTDDDADWEPSNYSATHTVTEADGNHYSQVQTRDGSTRLFSQNTSTPESSVHNEDRKKHQCPICQKKISKRYLEAHVRSHTGEKPFICAFCQKTFVRKCDLKAHSRVHTGEKPYSCPICNKSFTFNSNLHVHSRLHTGEKPYTCSVCNSTFAQKCVLEKHFRRRHARKGSHSLGLSQ